MARRKTAVTGTTTDGLIRRIKSRLGLSARTPVSAVSLAEVRQRVARLSAVKRRALGYRSAKALAKEHATRDETVRVFLAKVIAAALPDSLPWLAELLKPRPGAALAEVQFSLFCFLDIAASDSRPAAADVLGLVETYLLNISRESAHAAWMAGDLLGDHWPLRASLPVLTAAVSKGRFAAGRLGGIHGLSHALARASKREQWAIVDVLKQVALTDRSSRVRSYALSVLGDMRGT